MANNLKANGSGLRINSPRLLRVALIASLFSLIPTMLAPGTLSSANATSSTVACSVGGSFDVEGGVVKNGGSCSGAAVIPPGATSIGDEAFINSLITSVTIPNTVTAIGEIAFFSSSLATISIPNSVTSIGNLAFYQSALTTVNIPSSVATIGSVAFLTQVMTRIVVDPGNLNFSSLDGVLFNKDKTNLIQFPAQKPVSSYSIPWTVNSIGDYSFDSTEALISVSIPNSVTFIGVKAFEGSGLTSLTIPNRMTSIGDYAFFGMQHLTSITIPAGVTEIGPFSFAHMPTLDSVSIPDGVTTIGSNAFEEDNALTKITIPSSIIRIEGNAFIPTTALSVYGYCGNSVTIDMLDQSGLGAKTRICSPTSPITWDDQGATTASSGGSATYTNGWSVSTIPTTAPQKTGYTFVGWFTGATGGSQVTNGSTTPVSPYGRVTFYAQWSANRTSSVGTWAWTNQSSVGVANWHALAASADGSKLFAGVDGGSLYRSTDFGVTWSAIAGTSGHNWFSIASNIDGTKVAAVDIGPTANSGGDIWTSNDSGSTWSSHRVGSAVHNWGAIASSSNGAKLVAISGDGHIATSINSGDTWTDYSPPGPLGFTGVSSSNDGIYLAATTWANGIYTSANSGQTWTARSLPVPNTGSATYLQAVASSGDGSRLVTGSRTLAGGSNGGIIFTSDDYGTTWKAYAQTNLDYINFVSNGDGSRLSATIYGQPGVSNSSNYGGSWTFQSLGSNGVIPIASNIDGSLLFVGGYGGNLWTGKVPNSRVVAVLPSSTSATLAAGANTPATSLSFSASSSATALTVTPITNPVTEASTPFNVAQASIFDISVVNITGQVTICVDGGPNVRLWHYTNGAWVDVTTSQTATQTCGLTSSFSPFAAAPPAPVSLVASTAAADAAAKAAAEAAAAKREAEKQAARSDITSKLKSAKDLTVDAFAKAEIPGITATNIASVQAELLALPEATRTDINQVLKVAHKYEVVGNIGSDQINYMQSNSFVEIGLIPAESKNKVALVAAIRKLPAASRDTYAEIKAAIDAATKEIQVRSDRLAAIISRNATRNKK